MLCLVMFYLETQQSVGISRGLLSPALIAERQINVWINIHTAPGMASSTSEQTHSVLHWGTHTGFEGTE